MLKRFFHYCAGADLTLLESPDCRTDHVKYVGVGTAVFFTAVFAVTSASYALYYVFANWVVVLIGLLWGLFIFSLDRYIVSTMRKGVGAGREWQLAAPRLIIAIFLALIISKPLELQVFHQEIGTELQQMQKEADAALMFKIRQKNETIRPRIIEEDQKLEAELIALQKQRDDQEVLANNEAVEKKGDGANGKGTSGLAGAGSNYRRDTAQLHKFDHDLLVLKNRNGPLLKENREKLAQMDAQTQAEIEKEQKKLLGNGGLLSRIEALSRLTDGYTFRGDDGSSNVKAGSTAMYWASWVLTLLFVLIEITPVVVKLLSPAGPYDFKLNAIEKQVEAQEIERVSRANEEVNRSLRITLGENEQVITAQLAGNSELLKRLNQAQLELAQEMINQWKTGELQKLRHPELPDQS